MNDNGAIPPQDPRYYAAIPPPDPMQTSFKLDEGYSEETRSQAESETAFRSLSQSGYMMLEHGLPGWITAMNEADRSGE
jgi:F-box and WD-40 domain protein 1/11